MRKNKLLSLLVVSLSFILSEVLLSKTPSAAESQAKKIDIIVKELTPSLISIRRDLHAHPELSGQ